jgi:cyclic pyranopterin phosphate synthase
MPDAEDLHAYSNAFLMTAAEIASIAKVFCDAGIDKIRLTGGEPLVRKDAEEIITALSALPAALTLTTNGVRLHEFLPVLQKANINAINISLDTLNADTFHFITKRNYFDVVWKNIHACINAGMHVKVNVVLMKGINDHEINDFIALTKDVPLHVRFIEFMPFDGNKWSSNKVMSLQNILTTIESKYSFIKLKDEVNDTARKYIVPGHKGTFAIISTMSTPFCSGCNRLRLTADGKMKNCLFSSNETDLLTPFRAGENILPLMQQSVLSKAKETGGQLQQNFSVINTQLLHNRSMIDIGG